MMTRRQKNSIRGFTAVLSSCALIAGFLIFTNISNTRASEPVIFAEILEGAVDYSSDGALPDVTLGSEEMLETMFSDELETFTMTLDPRFTAASGTTVSTADTLPQSTLISSAEDTTTTTTGEDLMLLPNEPAVHSMETLPAPAASAVTSSSVTTAAPETQSYTFTQITPATSPATTTSTSSTPATTTTKAATTTTTTTTKVTTTTKTTTAAATTSSAATTSTREEDKTVFTNVGGGTFSTDTNVYLTMFRLVNNARKEAGLKELWYSARVHEVCELRTGELTYYYSHTRPDGTKFSTAFKEKGIKYTICGENIAYGKNMFKTPEEVFQAWMDSPSHKDNILNPEYECAAFGLSILKVGKDTYYYWSQEFASLA